MTEYDSPPYGPEMSPEEDAWHERELARGDLAYAPDRMNCYKCRPPLLQRLRRRFFHRCDLPVGVSRRVVRRGPILEPHRDPTSSYVLDCGHLGF